MFTQTHIQDAEEDTDLTKTCVSEALERRGCAECGAAASLAQTVPLCLLICLQTREGNATLQRKLSWIGGKAMPEIKGMGGIFMSMQNKTKQKLQGSLELSCISQILW